MALQASNAYACGSDIIRIIDVIYKLAPSCQNCGWRKLYLCIEKCCAKSPLFCKQCDWNLHLIHRTNEIRLLAINKQHLKSYKQVAGKSLSSLLSFLKKQRERCQSIIKEHVDMADVFTENIKQIEGILYNTKDSWSRVVEECVESTIFEKKPLAQIRRQFESCLKKINFWEDLEKELKSFKKTKIVLQRFQNNKLRDSEPSYGKNADERIQNLIQINNKECIEKLFKETCVQLYSKSASSEFNLSLTDMPDRARSLTKAKLVGSLRASRLFLDAENPGTYQYKYGQALKLELPFLTELHTPFEFSTFPQKQLKSLTYNLQNYSKTGDKNGLLKLPPSLITLRLRMANSNRPQIQIDHLINLKYFVLCDSIIATPDIKKLIRLALKNNMRMVCFLRNSFSKNHSKLGNWQYRFEADEHHRYPALRNHYLVYRRKLLQIMALHRTNLTSIPTYSRQEMLEATRSKMEIDMERILG